MTTPDKQVTITLNEFRDRILEPAMATLEASVYGGTTPDKHGQWQPIETAPNDGTLFLAHNDTAGTTAVVGWTEGWGVDDEGAWTDVGSSNCGIGLSFNGHYFSHWMPLPEPPK